MDKLFLLDAYALIYRSYFAFIKNPRINSKGLNTSAIFGFTMTLEQILSQEKPSHIAVAFDPKGGTFRNQLFPAYKANREETPEDIRLSIPLIKQILEAYNIPVIEAPNFEADDVIGTLAKQAAGEGFEVFMLTPDKDYSQLVEEHIKIYRPGRSGGEFEIWGVNEINAKFQIEHPLQVIDILGLWGDASDNIPGAPGIGEKTAQKLISQYGSIENLLEHLDELKGKMKESLEQNREQVLLSKKLATIVLDAPVQFDAALYKRQQANIEALKALFEQLEFRTMSNKLLQAGQITNGGRDTSGTIQFETNPSLSSTSTTASPAPGGWFQGNLFGESQGLPTSMLSLETIPHQFKKIESLEEIQILVEDMKLVKSISLSIHMNHIDPNRAEIMGLGISWQKHQAREINLQVSREAIQERLNLLKPILENPQVEKVGHGIKSLIILLSYYGIQVKGKLFDTLLAHYLLHPEQKHALDFLAQTALNYQVSATQNLSEEADVQLQLKDWLHKELQVNNLLDLANEIEFPLIPVLAGMEKTGVKLETENLKIFSQELTKLIIKVEEEIIQLAGMSFNVSSPKQLGDVLFEHLKLDDKAKKTKTGQYATNEETLSLLLEKHPIISKILDYRGYKKLLSTYVEALPLLINPKTGRIHTNYKQEVAATGRLSSVNPNLQNIPIREEQGRELRKAFVAGSPEHLFFSADYSQIELRLMAHLSQDEALLEAFRNGEDIHAATAAKIFHIPIEEVTRDMRGQAKTANFGIIYGISSFGLSQRLAISRSEGKALIDGYFESYPAVKSYMDYSIRIARDKGYVITLLGRRRELADIHSRNAVVRGMAERNAINAPIQGSAADIIKIAMIRIHKRFEEEKLRSRMILQVHDELNFDVYKPELEKVKEIVLFEMEQAVPLSVPLQVDCGEGNNWLEAH
ncbi:MAG: DNA polymerase I [Bacteroidales bacterium]|nr:DNA polymerase I [Bacteroidales bacterium]